jgi:hypothetical protein
MSCRFPVLPCALTMVLGLAACGSSPPKPPPRSAKVEPPPPPEPAAPVPSAYERRWQSACKDGGLIGHCPAPFDRPAVFIDVGAEGEDQPPAFCGTADVQASGDVHAALAEKRKALRACFGGAQGGAWVEVGRDGAPAPNDGPTQPARTAPCVAKIVKQTLAKITAGAPDRVIVLKGGTKDSKALSKQSIDEVIAGHASDVNTCYDGALEVWPGLRGRVAPTVVIWFDGSVALVRTGESSLHNPALECCINTAVSGWHFGKPAESAIVIMNLPFALGPAQ